MVISKPLSSYERKRGTIAVDFETIKRHNLIKSEQVSVLTDTTKTSLRAQQRYLCPTSSVQVGFEVLEDDGNPARPATLHLFEEAVVGSLEELYSLLLQHKPRKRIPGSLLSMNNGKSIQDKGQSEPGKGTGVGFTSIAVVLKFSSERKGVERIGEESVVVAVTRPESDEEGSNHELLEVMSLVLRRDKSELQLDWNTVKRSTVVVVKLEVDDVLARLKQSESLSKQ